MRLPLTLAAFALLAACDTANPLVRIGDDGLNDVQREFLFPVVPFQEGPVSVITAEGGEMRTYSFHACGARICAGSPQGRPVGVGDIDQDGVIELAAHGRVFRLMSSGTGVVVTNGVEVPLAWE